MLVTIGAERVKCHQVRQRINAVFARFVDASSMPMNGKSFESHRLVYFIK